MSFDPDRLLLARIGAAMTPMPHRVPARALALALGARRSRAGRGGAQWGRSPLPRSRADVLLDAGLWPQAEEAYYAQSRLRPRAPAPRAALGRYLAMKGAVLPGTVLIEEALKFGLDSVVWRARC